MISKNVIYFIVLSTFASALNYFMYPLLSRTLPSADYIDITVSLSLFTQISTFLISISAITIGLSKQDNGQNNNTIEQLQNFLYKIFSILAVLFLLLSPIIMSKIQTPSYFVIPIITMMLLSIPITVISGYFNGKYLMLQLGFIALISALNQFIIGYTTAYISNNAFVTMLSMAVAQLLTIFFIYKFFYKYNLPSLKNSFIKASKNQKDLKSLFKYTLFASIAIMIINIVQIVDIFILQELVNADIKFYTDIYIISRIVFFAGSILIWPFLGSINIQNLKPNIKLFFKLILYFSAITVIAILSIYLIGDIIANILFGESYTIQMLRDVAILSILYKFFFLIITSAILYFIVLRNYAAIWISLICVVAVAIYWLSVNKLSSMHDTLLALNIGAFIIALLSVASVVYISKYKNVNNC